MNATTLSLQNQATPFSEFSFEQYKIRTVLVATDIWFVAKDVCDALSLSNSRESLKALDGDEKMTVSLTDSHSGKRGGAQFKTLVNESGLYTLILRCRDAVKQGTVPHRFRKWVTSEVLPNIRKTGEYRKEYSVNPSDILTASQAEELRLMLKNNCDKLPKEKQGEFMSKGWSKLKSHFGVTYRQIPQREFVEAISLVTRHAAEWELIGSDQDKSQDDILSQLFKSGNFLVSYQKGHVVLNPIGKCSTVIDPSSQEDLNHLIVNLVPVRQLGKIIESANCRLSQFVNRQLKLSY